MKYPLAILGLLALVLVLNSADTALAYVGPGAGISLISAAIGLIVALVTAVGIVLLWPLRMLLRKMKESRPEGELSEGAVSQPPEGN